MEKERKVITVQIDEEFYDSLMAGGGNGGGETGTVEFLDLYDLDPSIIAKIGRMAYDARFDNLIYPNVDGLYFYNEGVYPHYVKVDLNAIVMDDGEKITVKDALIKSGVSEDVINSIPRISEDIFYTKLINFFINGQLYKIWEGYTWEELSNDLVWNSGEAFSVDASGAYHLGAQLMDTNGVLQYADTVIVEYGEYRADNEA